VTKRLLVDNSYRIRYEFGHIIQCVLNNIGINEWLNILYSTANFYDEQHFQPFAKIIISNFIRFTGNLPSTADKSKLYSYGLGYFHYIIKDHSNAIAYYDKALEIEPNGAYIWLNKGAAYDSLGQYEDAIKCYDEALRIDPKYVDALVNKGLVLNNLERYQEAIASYDKALEIEPYDANILYNRGLSPINLALYRDAIEYFNKALRIRPDYADALVSKGLALFRLAIDENDLHKYREAIECFDKALEIEPNNAHGRYHRAIYRMEQGRIEDGLADLEKAFEFDERYFDMAEREIFSDKIRKDERFIALMKQPKK
jgi:tetratricopeptide (TPR) repeat protein